MAGLPHITIQKAQTGQLYVLATQLWLVFLIKAVPPTFSQWFADRFFFLCQSGSWKMAMGGAGGEGLPGFLSPFSNKDLYCDSGVIATGNPKTYSRVKGWLQWDSDGMPKVKIYGWRKNSLGSSSCESNFTRGVYASCVGGHILSKITAQAFINFGTLSFIAASNMEAGCALHLY
jgi:hypothetical protein